MREAFAYAHRCLRCDTLLQSKQDQERSACAGCYAHFVLDKRRPMCYDIVQPNKGNQGVNSMSMTPPGFNVGGEPEYAEKGRSRWKLAVGDTEGSKSYFRVLTLDQVPGLSSVVSTLPHFMYIHSVPWQDAGRKKGQWPIPIYCLGSPGKPDATGNWPLSDDGCAECATVTLPSGRSLHSYGKPDPHVVMAVYQYTETSTPIEELRNWAFKATSHPKGMLARFRSLFHEAQENGGTINNIVWSLARSGDFLDLGCQVAHPGTNYAERFPFGDQQLQNIARCAEDCLQWFLPPHTKDQIIEEFKWDPKAQSAAPPYRSGTEGPGSTADLGV